MKKSIVFLVVFFSSNIAICQTIIGGWEHKNRDNEKVIIEFGEKFEYKITLPGRNLSVIDTETGMEIATELEYRLISGEPIKIEIISKISGQKFSGIIDFIDEKTLQMQINPILGGESPKKFDANSPDYVKLKRVRIEGDSI